MQLHTFNIKNYRSIFNISLSIEPGVNVLIGPNGCGKSNILTAINRFFEGLLLEKKLLRVEKSDFWFGTTKAIQFVGEVTHKNEKKMKMTYKVTDGLNLSINMDNVPRFSDIETLIGYYHYIPSERHFRNQYFSLRNIQYLPQRKFDSSEMGSEEALRPYVEMTINKPDELEELSDLISKVHPDLKKIYISLDKENQHGKLIAIINNYAIPFGLLSSGVQQLISFISIIHFSKNSLILIDEPELHMNPRMVIEISNIIQKSHEQNNNQFIIGTHSRSLISKPNINIIPLEYGRMRKVRNVTSFSTMISKEVSNEFVDKSFLMKED